MNLHLYIHHMHDLPFSVDTNYAISTTLPWSINLIENSDSVQVIFLKLTLIYDTGSNLVLHFILLRELRNLPHFVLIFPGHDKWLDSFE
jgi:hypothetical protein